MADRVTAFANPNDLMFQAVPAVRSVSKGTGGFTARPKNWREKIADLIGGDDPMRYQGITQMLGDRPGDTPENKLQRAIDPRETVTEASEAFGRGDYDTAAYDALMATPLGKTLSATGKIAAGVAAVKLGERLANPRKFANQLNMFLGPTAKNAYLPGFRAAKEWDKEGRGAQEILRKTGWFKGADGQWRFEIDDSKSEFKDWPHPSGSKLADVIEHPEFFANYPQYKDFPVYRILENPGIGGGIATDPSTGAPERMVLNRNMDPYIHPDLSPRPVLLHEMQHLVQPPEGFSVGGSPFTSKVTQAGHPGRKLYEDAIKTVTAEPAFRGAARMAKEGEAARRAQMQYYKRIIGETEARNVAKRMDFTPDMRRSIPPQVSQEFQASEQFPEFGPPQPRPKFPLDYSEKLFPQSQLQRIWPWER